MNGISATQAYSSAQPQTAGLSKQLTASLIALSQQKAAAQVATRGLNAATAQVSESIGSMVDTHA